MEGYGRWVALAIFIALLVFANIDTWKKNKWDVIFPLVFILSGCCFMALGYFIWNYW